MIKRNLPTLEEVAKAAKVSTATASRCLNEPHKVSAKTRERVLEVVKQLRYSPNFVARAIAAKRTNTYGVVIPTMENAIFARGIEAFQQTLRNHNATMLVASSSYDPEQEEHQIRTMIARGADGLMLIGTQRDPEIYSFLSDRNIPLVIAWACPSDKSHSYVGFDNRSSMKQLAQKAIELGHRSFAYISAKTRMNDRAHNRILGAKDALKDAGIDPDSMPIIETNQSIECGREAFHDVIANNARPTVIFGGNDVLAVGALQGAREAGLSVPDDICITGFDDIELATVTNPALTTVHVPHRDMGSIAAETLFSMVKESTGPHHIKLDTYIVERATLAPLKN
ncbi:MAG: LacI family DNA-binding transcriptional regulator [Hyphomicrobiales bacterium]